MGYDTTINFTLDTICPWTYIAKKRLDVARAKIKEAHPDVGSNAFFNRGASSRSNSSEHIEKLHLLAQEHRQDRPSSHTTKSFFQFASPWEPLTY